MGIMFYRKEASMAADIMSVPVRTKILHCRLFILTLGGKKCGDHTHFLGWGFLWPTLAA